LLILELGLVMGVWIDILHLGAAGQGTKARAILALELPAVLREFGNFSDGTSSYRGPLPKAIRHFAYSLPHVERPLLQTYESDLADYILESVMAEVERTLFLVELCCAQPEITLADLVALFPWTKGLNRSEQWKLSRIVRYLKSLIAKGILPSDSPGAATEFCAERLFEFDEIKYAVSNERLELSWNDFKDDHDRSDEFLCIDDSEESSDHYAEGADYGSIRMAEVVMNMTAPDDEFELKMDLRLLGESLGPELTALMEGMHVAKPIDGYRPIAWHNVFWRITEEFDWLALLLEIREPHQETDQALADHLAANYSYVIGISRPTIYRRRKCLDEACNQRIVVTLRDRFAAVRQNVLMS
jgi:hypothetical protein